MTQMNFFYLFIVLSIGWLAIWLFVIRNVPRMAPEGPINAKVAMIRERLLFPISAVLLVLLALSFYWMPYSSSRARTIGEPERTVSVDSLQWAWIMSDQEIPVDTVIQFDVTSRDVNHGFGIYSPEGKLLTQTQAMPGYTNKLIWKFDKPGAYTIRCLEYCGIGHHMMLSSFTVV